MTSSSLIRYGSAGLLLVGVGLFSLSLRSDPMFVAGQPPEIAQVPLYVRDTTPPLNMLVMGRDHKLYYEAYNDASDLNGDGVLDVGYKPDSIDYYGYYNSNVCYTHNNGLFVPAGKATGKKCSGQWSGDFLNYVTTSRMDALRKVLYGGHRDVDSEDRTILQASFTPQDAHSWGKEYRSVARDGYNIRDYTPLGLPGRDRYHLFAVTTLSDNGIPQMRVLNNTTFRVWNWVSIERPVAGSDCFGPNNNRVNCVSGSGSAGGWALVPTTAYAGQLQVQTWKTTGTNPGDLAAMNALFSPANDANNYCGTWTVGSINTTGGNNNNASGSNGCTHDNYRTRITGTLNIAEAGEYRFAVNGDDAVDVFIGGTHVAGWYGGHGANNSDGNLNEHSGTINLGVGTHEVIFRHTEGGGDDSWQLYWQPPNTGGATAMTDYALRVEVCPPDEALREAGVCKVYPSGAVKPTGILHEYGDTNRMYFGLLTGSYAKNTSGGVLRKNIGSFTDEVNQGTGQFCLDGNCGAGNDVKGIVHTITTFRMLDFSYDSHHYGCGWITTRPVDEGECWMWGNPVAEMMYETLRYFGGAKAARTEFDYSSGPDKDTLELAKPAWTPPYTAKSDGGGGYPQCSQPAMTVISDINPSYDYSLPGSHWDSIGSGADPASMQGLDVGAQVDAIWSSEGGGTRRIYIGESNGVVDNAPTPKDVVNLSTVRGLSPEEPSKLGTYYSAGVARFGATNRIGGDRFMRTYSVALASPLPKFEFPVGKGRISLVPFAKSVGGDGINPSGAFQPTNQIVDFYVHGVANLSGPDGPDYDRNVNEGRPYVQFAINFEDVEQGADHDMDAIVLYTLEVTPLGQLKVSLDSQYAAGGIDQYMGYVISGTTKDGIYLEVKDQGGGDPVYRLATPPGRDPGYCNVGSPPSDCSPLPLQTSRTFSVGTAASAGLLRDPLWYAAKYGTDQASNVDADGEPINYFLVTNPLYLRAQLGRAFDSAQNTSPAAGSAAISGARVGAASFTLEPRFRREREGKDWTGNLTAYAINADGSLGASLWNAQSGIPVPAGREIFTIVSPGDGTTLATGRRAEVFQVANLGTTPEDQLGKLGINPLTVAGTYGASYNAEDFVAYLRGDQSREAARGGAGNTLRTRTSVLGSIVNSEPVIAAPRSDLGYGNVHRQTKDDMFAGYASNEDGTGYLDLKSVRPAVAYVGANDGMLHAFNAATQPCAAPNARVTCPADGAGGELFAFVPNAVLGNLGLIPVPDEDYEHRYYVDGQISVGDIKSESGDMGDSWRTVLVGSTGGGARSVFALDVTDPGTFDRTKVLWERNSAVDNDIGYVYGKPLIVPLENGQWGVLFGNGYGGNLSDPSLYVLDAMTGAVIRKITGDDGDRGEAAQNPITEWICNTIGFFCARRTAPFNGLGQITAIDKDGNGKVDTVYGGDLQGNLWKFDLSGSNAASWSVANGGAALFTARIGSEPQPITGGIRVAAGPGIGVMVYFGTGRYLFGGREGDNNVPDDPTVQSLYAVFDNGTPVAGGRGALQPQAITSTVTAAGTVTRNISRSRVIYNGTGAKRGWYLDLQVNTAAANEPAVYQTIGERFIATPRIQSGRVFFTTFTPSEDSCNPGGDNFVYGLDLLSGSGALTNVQVQPSQDPACTGPDCGAIRIDQGGAPVTSTSVAAINPLEEILEKKPDGSDACTPGVDCPTFEQCQVVVYPGAFVLPRPCGRQSWRQLR